VTPSDTPGGVFCYRYEMAKAAPRGCLPVCGTCRSVSRILSALRRHKPKGRSSFIWDRRHRRPLAAYPLPSTGRLMSRLAGTRELFGLAPREVCPAGPVTRTAGGLLPHHFTHHRRSEKHRLVCFLLHLLSPPRLARRCLPVRKHGALWCSDFPRRSRRRDDPTGTVFNV